MPKSDAERAKEYLTRKRAHAREHGLCTRCCKKRPRQGRTICTSCRAFITGHIQRKRKSNREAVKFQQILALQEKAGDAARTYHLYADAVHYYQEALDVPMLALPDRVRITGKIIEVSLLNSDPKSAQLWIGRLPGTGSYPDDDVKSVEMLLHVRRQRLLDCKGAEALAAMARAVHIAKSSKNIQFLKLIQLRWVETLQIFGRSDEAMEALREIGHVDERDGSLLHWHYLMTHAWIAGKTANMESAYRGFELALELTKKDLDPNLFTQVWLRYGHVAQELGDTVRARACFEQGLFVAQHYRVTWLIGDLRLYYAQLLGHMGQSSTAYSYLMEAVSLSLSVPFIEAHSAFVGIPLALQVHDETMLARYARPEILKNAFQSELPDLIGGIASAFAQLYISRGRLRAARTLLQKAFQKISDARTNLDVLIAIAQYGTLADIPRARTLLEARNERPHADVFRAGLALFNAYVEKRRGRLGETRKYATDAAERFDMLQLHGYADRARSVLPGINSVKRKFGETVPFAHLQPVLTRRERDVATLVLQGLTNREIAGKLNIALHTVEKHMQSIMKCLGVRSRHQVAGALEATPE